VGPNPWELNQPLRGSSRQRRKEITRVVLIPRSIRSRIFPIRKENLKKHATAHRKISCPIIATFGYKDNLRRAIRMPPKSCHGKFHTTGVSALFYNCMSSPCAIQYCVYRRDLSIAEGRNRELHSFPARACSHCLARDP
jgi:hypothetical protein